MKFTNTTSSGSVTPFLLSVVVLSIAALIRRREYEEAT